MTAAETAEIVGNSALFTGVKSYQFGPEGQAAQSKSELFKRLRVAIGHY
jgi:hypothetical protein